MMRKWKQKFNVCVCILSIMYRTILYIKQSLSGYPIQKTYIMFLDTDPDEPDHMLLELLQKEQNTFIKYE